jgi:plasmid stabilization system protein ParE
VRLRPEAADDLRAIYSYIRDQASPEISRRYVQRITAYLQGFDVFPERGTRRDDISPGLRIVGFERRVTIAFVVERDEVIVLNILYGGRELPEETGG